MPFMVAVSMWYAARPRLTGSVNSTGAAGTPRLLARNSPTAMVSVSRTKTPSIRNPTKDDSPRPRMVRYQVMKARLAPIMKWKTQLRPYRLRIDSNWSPPDSAETTIVNV
jgi:hypothetical protein